MLEVQANSVETFDEGFRWGFMQELSVTLIIYIVSRLNPLTLIKVYNLKYLLLYIFGITGILTSGFRNALGNAILSTIISTLLRDRFLGFVKILSVLLALTSGAILVSYTPIKLPQTFQRCLCFLPGSWDDAAINDADNSTKWRMDMWEIILTSDKYIKNMTFGDGFGYLRADFERTLDIISGRDSLRGNEAQQEMFMLDGDFHSGPIGTVKFVGFVGFILFLPLLFFSTKMAIQLVFKMMNTKYQFITFFCCIPTIILPIFFLFIVGDYRQDFITLLFYIGMMKLIINSCSASLTA
jgi:hypothetical protein